LLVLPLTAAAAAAALVYVFCDNLASLNLTPHRVRLCGVVENGMVVADVFTTVTLYPLSENK